MGTFKTQKMAQKRATSCSAVFQVFKRRISHLLANVPYKAVQREKVKLPERQKAQGYRESDRPLRYVPERF